MTNFACPGGPSGYSLPLSPDGTSAAITPPPWHFSGEVIMIDYRVDAAVAARFLPPGLAPGPDAGAAAAVFATWQWCSASGKELADPVQCQFSEFAVLLACWHRDRPMARCPYAWVDRAVPMIRGWIQGMPKQLGSVYRTNVVTVGRAGPRLTAGGHFAGSLAVYDRRLVEAEVRLACRGEPPTLHTVPLVHSRVFPAWDPADQPVDELVYSEVSDIEFGEVWSGSADLRFRDVSDPGLASLAPVAIGAGHVFSYAETLCGGKRLDTAAITSHS